VPPGSWTAGNSADADGLAGGGRAVAASPPAPAARAATTIAVVSRNLARRAGTLERDSHRHGAARRLRRLDLRTAPFPGSPVARWPRFLPVGFRGGGPRRIRYLRLHLAPLR